MTGVNLFLTLLGGKLQPTKRLRSQIEGARVLAADSGIQHSEVLGLLPEIWIGDFDSAPEYLPFYLNSVPRKTFPVDKDKTDGELAFEEACRLGATRIILGGAFGGPRLDHVFLHLTAAIALAEKGIDVLLTSGTEEAVPVPLGLRTYDYPRGTQFSILNLSELSGLTVRGAKWPLDDHTVPFGSSLTLSNSVTGHLETRLTKGRALLIAQIQSDKAEI